MKYPIKRVSILDVPHRHVNLMSLDIYQFEPDSPASPGLSEEDSMDMEGCVTFTSILKKGDDSRFAKKADKSTCFRPGLRRKVTIIEATS